MGESPQVLIPSWGQTGLKNSNIKEVRSPLTYRLPEGKSDVCLAYPWAPHAQRDAWNSIFVVGMWGLKAVKKCHWEWKRYPRQTLRALQVSLLSCFSCHSVNKCPSHGLFGAMFSVFFYFFWWFHCFQWPPSMMLECCLVFLSARSSLWRKHMC